MNTLVIPITSANDYELVKDFIEKNLHHNFSWTNIKSFFFEKDDATFKPTSDCDAIALDREYPYPVTIADTRTDTETQYKEIEADLEQLYQNIGWLDAA